MQAWPLFLAFAYLVHVFLARSVHAAANEGDLVSLRSASGQNAKNST